MSAPRIAPPSRLSAMYRTTTHYSPLSQPHPRVHCPPVLARLVNCISHQLTPPPPGQDDSYLPPCVVAPRGHVALTYTDD